MNPPDATLDSAAPPAPLASPPPPAPQDRAQTLWIVAGLLAVGCVAAIVLAWQSQRRVLDLEQALVRRQAESQTEAAAAQLLAKQAEEMARETAAKQALLEARVSEVTVQRGQIEELIQSLSRSRDENVVVDIESALRVAMQQSALTGSAEPLVAALKQADERLARYSQPRLEGVRRAIARDLDAVKSLAVADVAALTIKLDEAVRMVDELPLVSQAEPRKDDARPAAAPAAERPKKGAAASAAADSASRLPEWAQPWIERWDALAERVWAEARSLVRVTRIDHPEAMFVAPEQAYFLRENLKLRLMNARLALLARQFDTVQADLQSALGALGRYFDPTSRRTQLTATLIRQVAGQARQVSVPRPEATLAALSTAAAGR